MTKKTLFLVAGGSGGHIVPALELAKQWKQTNPAGYVLFFGQKASLDQKILEHNKFLNNIIYCALNKFSLRKFWRLPALLWQIPAIFLKSFYYCLKLKPTKIITTGGLIAIPVCLAGRLLGKYIVLYELNVIPGKAIKLLSIFAHKIAIVFQKTALYFNFLFFKNAHKCELHTYPIRFTQRDKIYNKPDLIALINTLKQDLTPNFNTHNFDISRKTLFILGGSQGSLLLNNLIKKFIEQNSQNPDRLKHIQVIHQTGKITNPINTTNNNKTSANWTNWPVFYNKHNIPAFTFDYYDNIKNCYALSDLVICRAGAGTLFELVFFEKPCIIIPLVAQTTNHQVANAHEIAAQYPQLCTVIEQEEVQLNPELLFKSIIKKL